MIAHYIKGNVCDMFEANSFDAMMQGCNCFHAMRSGVAKEIAERFPLAEEADNKTEFGDWTKLGTYSKAELVHGDIINAYTQFRPGLCPWSILKDGLTQAFKLVNKDYAGKTVGIPKIGSGVAGGNWEEIAKIIQSETPDVNIIVVEFE